jgi:uncharacterized protein (TIGR02246 family)
VEGRLVPTILEGLVGRWAAAVKVKDSEALASLVTEDCIFLAPNAPPMRGRLTVERLYQNLFARYDLLQVFRFEEIQLTGDWAFAWGVDDITMTPVAGGDSLHFVGHGMSILRREPNGTWLFARGFNNATRQT